MDIVCFERKMKFMKLVLAKIDDYVYIEGNRINSVEAFRIFVETESGGNSGESRFERVPKVQGLKKSNLSGKRTEQDIREIFAFFCACTNLWSCPIGNSYFFII